MGCAYTVDVLPCSSNAPKRSFDRLPSPYCVLYPRLLCGFLGCTSPITPFYDCRFRWHVGTLALYRPNIRALGETGAIARSNFTVLIDWVLYTLFDCRALLCQ